MKMLIIAGNDSEAMRWIKEDISANGDNGLWRSISDYIIVHRPQQIKGLHNPTGRFVGNWRSRSDLLEIIQSLIAASSPANPALINLFNSINSEPIKYQGLKTMQVILDELSEDLAKQIDSEVLASICNKINGGIIE